MKLRELPLLSDQISDVYLFNLFGLDLNRILLLKTELTACGRNAARRRNQSSQQRQFRIIWSGPVVEQQAPSIATVRIEAPKEIVGHILLHQIIHECIHPCLGLSSVRAAPFTDNYCLSCG